MTDAEFDTYLSEGYIDLVGSAGHPFRILCRQAITYNVQSRSDFTFTARELDYSLKLEFHWRNWCYNSCCQEQFEEHARVLGVPLQYTSSTVKISKYQLLCAVPKFYPEKYHAGRLAAYENVWLQQKLLIEADEQEFLSRANRGQKWDAHDGHYESIYELASLWNGARGLFR